MAELRGRNAVNLGARPGATAGLSSSASSENPARRGTGQASSGTHDVMLARFEHMKTDRTLEKVYKSGFYPFRDSKSKINDVDGSSAFTSSVTGKMPVLLKCKEIWG